MRKFFAILVTLLFLGSTLGGFAAPFPDLPADHWATNAVVVLAEKGLVEGYPNGTFRGRRPATRYEVSLIVARLLATLEKQKPQVTQEDLNNIKQLVENYREELETQGVRLSQVEKLLDSLQSRVAELERVKWNGGFETRYITDLIQSCASCTPSLFRLNGLAAGIRLPYESANPQRNSNPQWNSSALWNSTDLHLASRETDGGYLNVLPKFGYDAALEGFPNNRLYPVVPSASGSAITQGGYLNVRAKLGNDYEGGGVISFYNNVGNLGNGYVYGVTPNTIANPFQAGTPALFGVNLSTNLNQIYVENRTQDVHVAVGDWRPAYIPDFLLQGLPNMGVYGPDYLPFYGGQIYGTLHSTFLPGVSYEGVAGRISTNNPTTYQNLVFGGAVNYTWQDNVKNGAVFYGTGSYIRALNDVASVNAGTLGGVINPGFWASPATPLSAGTLNSSTGVGPQTENLYGADLAFIPGGNWHWVTLFGKWGNSRYLASPSSGTSNILPVSGNLYNGGVKVDKGRLTFKGEYLWVSPRFDPFVSRVPISTSSFANNAPALWLGFPYSVAYGPPYTGFLAGPQALSFPSGNNDTNLLTNGAGDVFFSLHDARKYPNNRNGFRTNLVWNFGGSHLGGTYENLRQVQISSLAAELTPGFTEPVFFTLPTYAGITQPTAFTTPIGQGRTVTYSLYGDWTAPDKTLTLDGLYINSQIKRFEPDFNNIDLLMNWWRGGLTYRPTNQWAILGGYAQLNSGGAGDYLQAPLNIFTAVASQRINGTSGPTVPSGSSVPSNYRFRQKGPYFGVNYNFVKSANAWILYQMANFSDNNVAGQAGYASTQVQSGMQFAF